MFRTKETSRPQVKRFDWKIDLAIVVALLLSAGMGIAFVFYSPEAVSPENSQAVSETQIKTAAVGQSPENHDLLPILSDHGPESVQLPAEEPPGKSEEPPGNLEEDQPTDPVSPGPAPSPLVSPGIGKTAASHSRAPKAPRVKVAVKKPRAKQAAVKKATHTRQAPKKK